MAEVLEIALSAIKPDPENPRSKITGVDELAASLDFVGLLEPVRVRQLGADGDGLYLVVNGHRRLEAARKLDWETIDAILVDVSSAEDEAMIPVEALAANTARTDLGAEELGLAIGKLNGMGISDQEIIRALAVDETTVAQALVIAAAPKKARTVALKGLGREPTLIEAAALVKYSDNPDDLMRLRATIVDDPSYLPHDIAGIEQRRTHERQVTDLLESLGDVARVAEWREHQGPPAGVQPLANLLTEDGKRLTTTNHIGCPGHAVVITNVEADWDKPPKAVFVCRDYPANSHQLKDASKAKSKGAVTRAAGDEAASAARREVITNNRAWEPATEVRLEWLVDYLARTKPSARADIWMIDELLKDSRELASLEEALVNDVITEAKIKGDRYGGWEIPASITGARRRVLVLGMIVAARERQLKTSTWRPQPYHREMLARYLSFLGKEGYPLSAVEKIVATAKGGE